MATDGAAAFLFYWRFLGTAENDEPQAEYRFHPKRRFRFDYCWPTQKIAVEVDGGQWQPFGGRHATDGDREKLNMAAEMGWRVLRFSPQMLQADPEKCVRQVERTLKGTGDGKL